MLMRLIRLVLGRIILALDWMFKPTAVQRTPALQTQVDQAIQGLVLYQFEACPFCVKVRRELKRLGIVLELRNAGRNSEFRAELLKGGGAEQVPCLRIPEGAAGQFRWLYESDDIIQYLNERVGAAG